MSKWWKDMFIPKGEDECIILSKEKPINYNSKSNIEIKRGINKYEYDDFCDFIKTQNKMASGNFTLLPKGELDRYINFDAKVITMRGIKNKLIGTILSIPLPIKCSVSDKTEIIVHGSTSFLNVYNILRNNGLAMGLIREMIAWGYEDNIYCDYHMTHNKIHEKAFKINSWYRPINLPKSIGLGFLIPNWNSVHEFKKNRLKYSCKSPSGFKIIRVSKKNQEQALKFYKFSGKEKKFIFWPDLDLFAKWIQQFPTYMVQNKNNKKMVGIFSFTSLYCRMEDLDGNLCLPLFFNCLKEFGKETMKGMIYAAKEKEYDTLYMYETGDMTRDVLKSVFSLETKDKSWFSLYNNSMNLNPESISVPLI